MTIPSIQPVGSDHRPLWSVMIPTYHPDIAMLREAIAGALASGADRASMHIALADDASGWNCNSARWNEFARECRDGGIEIHQFNDHLGLAGNWNRCLDLSRGHYVHLLYQDDRVHPTFYDAISNGFVADPRVGAAFVQHALVNRQGRLIGHDHLNRDVPGIVDDWLEYVVANPAIQCTAIVVRRSVYERLGGFDASYRCCCDREMWQRVAMEYPIWFDPRPLSESRISAGNTSARLRRQSAASQHQCENVKCTIEGRSPSGNSCRL